MVAQNTDIATAAESDRLRHYRDGHDHRAAATLVRGPRVPLGGVSGVTQIGGAR